MAAFFWFLFLTLNSQPSPLFGATKLFLRVSISPLAEGVCSPSFTCFQANTVQGSSMNSYTTSSIAGPLTGHYWPIATTGYITTSSGGSKKDVWISAPLSSGVTISGTITPNIWGYESNNACNCGFRYEVLRWSAAEGGIVSSLGIATDNGATEWGTSAAVRTSPTLTPTSTAFAVGDRIVIVVYNDDANGVTEASGRSWNLDIAGPAGADGDTYLSFTETISFSPESNNARSLPMTSRAIVPTLFPLVRSAEGQGF